MAAVSRIKEIADINQPNKLLIEMIEKLPSFQNNPIQDGVLAPSAVTFQVVLAQDPLAAQGPRGAGAGGSPGAGRRFSGPGHGGGAWDRLGQPQPYVRTPGRGLRHRRVNFHGCGAGTGLHAHIGTGFWSPRDQACITTSCLILELIYQQTNTELSPYGFN